MPLLLLFSQHTSEAGTLFIIIVQTRKLVCTDKDVKGLNQCHVASNSHGWNSNLSLFDTRTQTLNCYFKVYMPINVRVYIHHPKSIIMTAVILLFYNTT